MTSGYARVEGAGGTTTDTNNPLIHHTIDYGQYDGQYGQHGCPSCGRCPHCGRGNYDYHPPTHHYPTYDCPPHPNGNRVVWC